MANMCENYLRISGPADDVGRFKERAMGYSPWHMPVSGEAPEPLNFHSLLPIPDEVLAAGYHAAGYEWEYEHWGCKWGACGSRIVDDWDEGLLYEFDSAWSPPLQFIEQVSRQWPTLVFVLEYEESGDGYKGLAKAEAGTLEDHCINL